MAFKLPANNSSLAQRVLPCNAAFINGVNPRRFRASISILRLRVNSILIISDWPIY